MVAAEEGGTDNSVYGPYGRPVYGTSTPTLTPPPTSGAIAGSGEVATTAAVASSLATIAAESTMVVTLTSAPPTAKKPLEGLPANPRQGVFYQFASSPTTLYLNGPDNVWRALLLVPVS